MSLVPVNRLKKTELIWLGSHRCKHSHLYISHYDCYLEEHPNKEMVGFLDIEASNLSADYGIILSYAIKELGKNKIYKDVINPRDLKKDLDKKIVSNLIKDLGRFDRIYTYFGTRFDCPYIRTRAVVHNLDFPEYGTKIHNDIYYIIKSKFNLSSKRLENACRVLVGETQKTRIDPAHWLKALQGDKRSLAYILDHNIKDVLDLEKLYKKVINYVSRRDTSI